MVHLKVNASTKGKKNGCNLLVASTVRQSQLSLQTRPDPQEKQATSLALHHNLQTSPDWQSLLRLPHLQTSLDLRQQSHSQQAANLHQSQLSHLATAHPLHPANLCLHQSLRQQLHLLASHRQEIQQPTKHALKAQQKRQAPLPHRDLCLQQASLHQCVDLPRLSPTPAILVQACHQHQLPRHFHLHHLHHHRHLHQSQSHQDQFHTSQAHSTNAPLPSNTCHLRSGFSWHRGGQSISWTRGAHGTGLMEGRRNAASSETLCATYSDSQLTHQSGLRNGIRMLRGSMCSSTRHESPWASCRKTSSRSSRWQETELKKSRRLCGKRSWWRPGPLVEFLLSSNCCISHQLTLQAD